MLTAVEVGGWLAASGSEWAFYAGYALPLGFLGNAATFTPLNKYLIVNIANEWGPANSTVWRDSYITAIAAMRKAGYLGTLLIDAGGCGQDLTDLVTYSSAVPF